VQKITIFSAGIVTGAKEPEAGRALIRFLASAAAAPVIAKSGLDPMVARGEITRGGARPFAMPPPGFASLNPG
jgi:hypothetical protein